MLDFACAFPHHFFPHILPYVYLPKDVSLLWPKKPIKVSSLASRHFMLGHGFPSLSLLANARSSHVLNDSSVLKSSHQIKFRSECPRYANVCLRMVIAIGSRSGVIRVSALVRFPSRRSDAANVRVYCKCLVFVNLNIPKCVRASHVHNSN